MIDDIVVDDVVVDDICPNVSSSDVVSTDAVVGDIINGAVVFVFSSIISPIVKIIPSDCTINMTIEAVVMIAIILNAQIKRRSLFKRL